MSSRPGAARVGASSSSSASAAPARSRRDDDDSDEEGVGGSSSVSREAPPPDPKALELLKQADKKFKSFSLFNSQQKFEDGVEILGKAASQFKMNKNWKEAGDTYVQMAEVYESKLKDPFEAASSYDQAAKAYKNCDIKEAIRCFILAVENQMENNRFASAAKIWKEVGGLHEKEYQLKEAMSAYSKAADCFEAENSTANANGCHVKVAGLAAETEDYDKAVKIYEKLMKACLDNSSLRWSVKDYQFRALLCKFVVAAKNGDLDDVEATCNRYRDMNPQFDDTRECNLILDLIEDFKEDDENKFTDHVFRFDEIIKLDNWTAKVLLQIKKSLKEGPQGKPDEDDLR